MRITHITSSILALAIFTAPVFAGEEPEDDLPAKESFHLFLLAGQSNMAGRGIVEPLDREIHARVLALSKEGKWEPAVDPIHFDKGSAGVGLGKSFGIAVAEGNEEITIGLIPAACGGSPISTWKPGGYHDQTKSHPYDDAIARTRRAMRDGVLKGILWHQGESDSRPELAEKYKQESKDLIERFRKDLDAPSVPFIIGQLGQFGRPWSEPRKLVNQAHVSLAEEFPAVGFVPSDGLTCKKDNIHFDANSLREFGRRYAEVYQRKKR